MGQPTVAVLKPNETITQSWGLIYNSIEDGSMEYEVAPTGCYRIMFQYSLRGEGRSSKRTLGEMITVNSEQFIVK